MDGIITILGECPGNYRGKRGSGGKLGEREIVWEGGLGGNSGRGRGVEGNVC